MKRRDFCKLMTVGAGLGSSLGAVSDSQLLADNPSRSASQAPGSSQANGNYPNNREPLLATKYIRLPLGSIRPSGWLHDQLEVQASGLTSHLDEVWNVLKFSAWKGDIGENVTPECCTARFAPRWLEGTTVLAGVLDSNRLKTQTHPYMEYILTVKNLATITPSVCAWSHLGRFLPDYYDLTGDERTIKLARKILDYADSVRGSKDHAVVDPARLGMLLSFGYWYYNRTGDRDVPALLERCAKSCVNRWAHYFVTFPENPKYFVHFPDEPQWKGVQGVDLTQAIGYPILYYLLSRNVTDKESVLKGIANLDEGYGQVGGRWNADEWLSNTDPTQGTECCDVEELLFSLETNFEAIGDLSFADRMEQLIFNAFPGTCTADMWAHQYDQQANQVLVSVAKRPWRRDGDTSNIYGFTPNFPCCLSNMHSPWPRYVKSMWMATADKGLVAAAYGPCRLKANVGEGSTVEINEDTDYPFSDRIRFTIHCERPASFPIYFRIPVWANQAELSVSAESGSHHPQKGTLFKVERLWKSGDVVSLSFNFKVRTETRKNNSAAIAWGPLYFVLRIVESFQKIPSPNAIPKFEKEYQRLLRENILPAPPGCVNWEISPSTDWNYALAIDRDNPHCTMTFNGISSMPFAQKGEPVKAPGASTFTPWQEDVPIVLKFKARKVPQWSMNGANAASVPVSPVSTDSPESLIELIPYGCSRLRISEFPTT